MTRFLKRLSEILNKSLAVVACVALFGIMLVMVLNMFLRMFFFPLIGTYDIVGWLGAIAIGLGLGYTQIYKEHVSINIIVDLFPSRIRMVILAVMTFAGAVFFGFLTFWVFWLAVDIFNSGQGSRTLHWAEYPLTFLVSFGCATMTLSLVVDFFLYGANVIYPDQAPEPDVSVEETFDPSILQSDS